MSESIFINYDNIYPVCNVVNNWSMYNQYFIDIIINGNDDLSKILNNISENKKILLKLYLSNTKYDDCMELYDWNVIEYKPTLNTHFIHVTLQYNYYKSYKLSIKDIRKIKLQNVFK